MRKYSVILGLMLMSQTGFASYPFDCQLDQLSVAVPALKSDQAMLSFFDLTQVSFSSTEAGEPIVLFTGTPVDSQYKKCIAKVQMHRPEDVLGCPSYSVQAISVECQAKKFRVEPVRLTSL